MKYLVVLFILLLTSCTTYKVSLYNSTVNSNRGIIKELIEKRQLVRITYIDSTDEQKEISGTFLSINSEGVVLFNHWRSDFNRKIELRSKDISDISVVSYKVKTWALVASYAVLASGILYLVYEMIKSIKFDDLYP